MRFEGSNGSVEYLYDRVVIRRKGIANVLTQGVQGDKTIPISRITAVQFRSAGAIMAGLIQFTIQGGREFRGGMMEATKDENAVLFTRDQEPAFTQLRETIESAIMSERAPVATGRNDVDDLAKIADLYERGHLTKDEFDERKRLILAPESIPRTATGRERLRQTADYSTPTSLPTGNVKRAPVLLPGWVWTLLLVGVIAVAWYNS